MKLGTLLIVFFTASIPFRSYAIEVEVPVEIAPEVSAAAESAAAEAESAASAAASEHTATSEDEDSVGNGGSGEPPRTTSSGGGGNDGYGSYSNQSNTVAWYDNWAVMCAIGILCPRTALAAKKCDDAHQKDCKQQ